MAASDQIFLVVDAGTPVAAFTARRELTATSSAGSTHSLTRWSIGFGTIMGRRRS